MARIGIMIEGQEGLDWDRWRRLCAEVEGLGFATLRRSDHLQSVMGDKARDALDCWTSLALAAEWTRNIEIGPMVSPVTFFEPAVLARHAAAVDALSGGRLLLGVGAGWNQPEHDAFSIEFPPIGARFDRLERAIGVILRTWETSRPRPPRDGRVPFVIGGGGERRTLPIAAAHAAEWNYIADSVDTYRARAGVLDALCAARGRDPREIRRSIMSTYVAGRDAADLRARATELGRFVPGMRSLSVEDVIGRVRFSGTPREIIDKMRPWVEAGVELFVLQHLLLDDSEQLRLLAEEVAPALEQLGR